MKRSKLHSLLFWRIKSLYLKLAISFAIVIALTGIVQMATVTSGYQQLVDTIDQRTYWPLAANMVELLAPQLEGDVSPEELEQALFKLYLMNPRIELFVLDMNGEVLTFVSPRDTGDVFHAIDVGFITTALEEREPELPSYGPHPEDHNERHIFSAAPLQFQGKQAYLYVLLTNQVRRKNIQFLGQRFIVLNLFLGLLAVTVLAALLGVLLFRFLTKHFRSLTEVVRRYREGDYTTRADVSSEDEIADLAEAVNQMADKIVLTQEQRKQLMAGITHDLRGPLTSIRGFVELLQQEELSPQRREEYLEIIHSNVRLQERLVADLSELSKLQTSEMEPEWEYADIDDLVQDVAVKYRPQAEEKSLELDVALEEDIPEVLIDTALIERVLTNLITNAIRYTPAGGRISVQVERKDQQVMVSVRDNGPGIAESELSNIFDAFHRSRNDSPDDGGRGLGLAIVKTILELHHSDIEVESRVGIGTVFRFYLPTAHSGPPGQDGPIQPNNEV